jgi:hypothetical protein
MLKSLSTLKIIFYFLFTTTLFFGQEKPNNEALIVLNGNIVHNDIMKIIHPKNFASLNILKSESATEIYGEIAKNGAIVITTKNISEKELKRLYELYPYKTELNNQEKAFIVTGTISDCQKVVYPDAKIINLNSLKETTSDFDGNFSIEVRKGDILKISWLDFEERVLVKNTKKIEIIIEPINDNDKIIVAKPVIYLYPTEKKEIDLQLNFNGKLLTTFPKYDKNWEVIAEPNGQIFDMKTNRYYSSLFWDGTIDFPEEHYKYDDGYIVPKEKLTEFFIEKLEYIGLNNQETNEFIQYWLPILERNKYNFIHFLVNEECNEIATLKANPKPETTIRIYMEFYGLENFTVIKEQQLPKTERKGFTLVEWGGADFSGEMSEEDFISTNNLSEYITVSFKRKKIDDIKILYVIDNKISSKKAFDKLHPSQIKKIETYSGEKGAALYGQLGMNGVFEITTKNPKQ